MKRLLPFCLVIACVACKPPCTHCPKVAGTYYDTSGSDQKTCDGDTIIMNGGTIPVTITQNGSSLTLAESFSNGVSMNLTGTLYDDNTATFGPGSVTLEEEDSDQLDEQAGTAELQGAFFPGSSEPFTGVWSLTLNNDYGCTATSAEIMTTGIPDAGPTD